MVFLSKKKRPHLSSNQICRMKWINDDDDLFLNIVAVAKWTVFKHHFYLLIKCYSQFLLHYFSVVSCSPIPQTTDTNVCEICSVFISCCFFCDASGSQKKLQFYIEIVNKNVMKCSHRLSVPCHSCVAYLRCERKQGMPQTMSKSKEKCQRTIVFCFPKSNEQTKLKEMTPFRHTDVVLF